MIQAYVDELDLHALGCARSVPADTGRPGYAPDDLLALYLYGYCRHIRSSRRLEDACRLNLELMWRMRQLTPDHKSIAEFRRINLPAVRQACSQFV